jgi:C1A family cysteine protease
MADIAELNQLIEEAGAHWVAKQTPLSDLVSIGGPEGMLGLALSPEEALAEMLDQRRIEQTITFAAPPPLPPRLDWRDHKGENWVTPVKDQKTCNSCVAFAACAAIEARVRIETNKPDAAIDLSEAQLFHCGTPNSCGTGWQPEKAMDFARQHGIGRESDFPYHPGNQACRPIAPIVKTSRHGRAATILERKRALLGGPVIAGMEVFRDFRSYGSGVYRHVSGDFEGLHAVCVIGFDDPNGCWIAKNSWGRNWGDDGFFRIAYGDCGIDSKFTFTVPGRVQLL